MLFKFRACERVLWFCPHSTVITTESTSSKQSGSRFCELMRKCLTWGRWTAQPRHFHRTAPSLHSGSNSHQSILHPLHEPPYTSPPRDCGVGYGYTVCLEGLGPVVRELWSRNCQMTIDRFVSFLGPFTNPEELQLRDNRIPAVEKIKYLDRRELPYSSKGTLQIRRTRTQWKHFAYSIHQLSVLVASRRMLIKLEFPNCEFCCPII